jgi:hypothetical protein
MQRKPLAKELPLNFEIEPTIYRVLTLIKSSVFLINKEED